MDGRGADWAEEVESFSMHNPQTMRDWLKHAFAVNTETAPPGDDQMQMVDRLAREVVRRRLARPAILFLEMSQPLNYLGAQAMHFFSPFLTAVFDARGCEAFAKFLERRDAIELLCQRIEQLEQQTQPPPAPPVPAEPPPS
jgi:hypothetical protein